MVLLWKPMDFSCDGKLTEILSHWTDHHTKWSWALELHPQLPQNTTSTNCCLHRLWPSKVLFGANATICLLNPSSGVHNLPWIQCDYACISGQLPLSLGFIGVHSRRTSWCFSVTCKAGCNVIAQTFEVMHMLFPGFAEYLSLCAKKDLPDA